MKAQVRTIGIILTFQCNAQCRMCCFECGPDRKEQIPTSVVERVIKEAATHRSNGYASLKTIAFSGGEPFLRYQDLLKFVGMAHDFEFESSCTTNCFWAKTPADAERIVAELCDAGLTKLSISADRFHGEYIPVKNVANVLRAAKKHDLPCDIGSIITHSECDLGDMFSELGELLIGVRHIVAPCLPVGSAAKHIESSDYIYDPTVAKKNGHCSDLSMIAIYPDGEAYPCCSQMGRIEAFRLGNVFQDEIGDLCKRYHSNMLVRIAAKHGIGHFVKLAKQVGHRDFESESYIGVCDLCYRVFSDTEFIKKLEPYLESYRRDVYAKYLRSIEGEQTV